MSQSLGRFSNAKIHHQSSLVDGGPENYRKWYHEYDDYTINVLHASQADSVTSVWKRYHPKDHLTAALQTSGQKHKIFDAGCGTGQLTTEILKSIPEGAVEIFGGDYSPEML